MSTNTTSSWKQKIFGRPKRFDEIDVVKGFIAFLAQVFIITAGALLINNQIKLTRHDPEEGVVLNYTVGSILIVIGSLMVLYSMFLLIRGPAKTS